MNKRIPRDPAHAPNQSGTAPIDLHLKSDPGAAKRLTAESLTPLLRGRITGVDVLAK